MPMRQQTCASQVLEALRILDEFATGKQVLELTGLNRNQVSASLVHLRRRGLIDVVVQHGLGWWFAVPNAIDANMRNKITSCPVKRKRPTGLKHPKGKALNKFTKEKT